MFVAKTAGNLMIAPSLHPLRSIPALPRVAWILLSGLSNLYGQVLISRWDFNTASLTPEYGPGEARLVGGVLGGFATGFEGESAGAWNLKGFPSQGTSPGTAGVQFSLSTQGHSSVGLSFQIRHSNTSANLERVLWSTDGGPFQEATRFRIVPEVTGSGETWYQRSVALPSAAAGQAELVVRIVSDFDPLSEGRYMASRLGSSYSTAGTWRFDNVTFSAVPEPEEYAMVTAWTVSGMAIWRRVRRAQPRKAPGESLAAAEGDEAGTGHSPTVPEPH